MGRAVDLNGRTFGRLTVLNKAPTRTRPNGGQVAYWLCKCECGKEVEVTSQSLVNGHTKGCGCKRGIDLTGQVFGRLTVLERAPDRNEVVYWRCQCECGKLTDVCRSALKGGSTISCGCYRAKATHLVERYTTHGATKGNIQTTEFRSWTCMKNRCYDNDPDHFLHYQGRGITVCERWLGDDGFINFLADMGPKPSKRHQIDRIDVNGNYEPSNCKWSSPKEQMRNRRNTIFVTHQGQTKSLKDWSEELGFEYELVRRRIRKFGMSFEEAISRPKHANRYSGNQWFEEQGIPNPRWKRQA